MDRGEEIRSTPIAAVPATANVPLGSTIPFEARSTKKQTSSQPSPACDTTTSSVHTEAANVPNSPRRSSVAAPIRPTSRPPISVSAISPAELMEKIS